MALQRQKAVSSLLPPFHSRTCAYSSGSSSALPLSLPLTVHSGPSALPAFYWSVMGEMSRGVSGGFAL